MTFNPPNYTQTPNELFDLQSEMSEAELRVTLEIVRATFGWNQGSQAAQLTIEDLRQATGMSKQGVLNGVDAGRKRGSIVTIKQGREVYYGLSVRDVYVPEKGQRSRPKTVNLVDRNGQPGRPNVPAMGQRRRPNGSTTLTDKVNLVDPNGQRSRPNAGNSARRSASKTGAQRQTDNERQERQTDRLSDREPVDQTPQPQPGSPAPGVLPAGGADRAGAAGAATPGNQDPSQVGAASPATGNDPATGEEKVPGAAWPALEGAFRPWDLPKLQAENPLRERWNAISPERIQELELDARERCGRKYRGELAALLDDEVVHQRRQTAPAPEPTSQALPITHFHVGQRVLFKGFPYTVEKTTDRTVFLYDDVNGSSSVTIGNADWSALKPAPIPARTA